jgi:hypothetical protein
MFDSYNIRAGDQHHHHRSEVHEHRAPTDASVKLLREMEAAALGKVLASYRLEGCEVDCVVHHMHDHMNDEAKFIVQYRLGGRRVRVDHTHRTRSTDSGAEARQRLVSELLRVVGESIAAELLAPSLTKALGRGPF